MIELSAGKSHNISNNCFYSLAKVMLDRGAVDKILEATKNSLALQEVKMVLFYKK